MVPVFDFSSAQSSIHVMDTIAYYKAQSISQRNASVTTNCRVQANVPMSGHSSLHPYQPTANTDKYKVIY